MEGKSLILYYSWVGSTQVVAKEIQRLTGFDMQRIEEEKERKFSSLGGAAMGAFFGLKSKLKPLDFTMAGYQNILLGAQIWAGKTTPAMNTFLSKADFTGKRVWLFITLGDDKIPQKFIESVTRRIEKTGGQVMGSLCIQTEWDPKTNIPIATEKVADKVAEWVQKLE